MAKVNQLALFILNVTLLLTVGCPSLSARAEALDDGWLKLEAGAFSLYAPAGWEFREKLGVDSYVGEFSGDGIVLKFDYGRYSNDLRDAVELKYVVTEEKIGGHKAKIVYPRTSGPGITGIYFSKIVGSDKLCLWGQDLTESQRELALKIFKTIQFPRPRRVFQLLVSRQIGKVPASTHMDGLLNSTLESAARTWGP